MAQKTPGKVTRPEALTNDEFAAATKAANALEIKRAADAQAFVDITAREKLKAADDERETPFDKVLELAVVTFKAEQATRVDGGSPSSDKPANPPAPKKGGKAPQSAPKTIATAAPATMEPGPELDADLALDDDDTPADTSPLDIEKVHRPEGMTEARYEQLVADAISYGMSQTGAQAYVDSHIGTVASTKTDKGSYPSMLVGREKVHCPTARLPDGRLTRSIPREGTIMPWYLHPADPPKGCVIIPEEIMTMAAEEGLTDAEIRDLMKHYARKERMRALTSRRA